MSEPARTEGRAFADPDQRAAALAAIGRAFADPGQRAAALAAMRWLIDDRDERNVDFAVSAVMAVVGAPAFALSFSEALAARDGATVQALMFAFWSSDRSMAAAEALGRMSNRHRLAHALGRRAPSGIVGLLGQLGTDPVPPAAWQGCVALAQSGLWRRRNLPLTPALAALVGSSAIDGAALASLPASVLAWIDTDNQRRLVATVLGVVEHFSREASSEGRKALMTALDAAGEERDLDPILAPILAQALEGGRWAPCPLRESAALIVLRLPREFEHWGHRLSNCWSGGEQYRAALRSFLGTHLFAVAWTGWHWVALELVRTPLGWMLGDAEAGAAEGKMHVDTWRRGRRALLTEPERASLWRLLADHGLNDGRVFDDRLGRVIGEMTEHTGFMCTMLEEPDSVDADVEERLLELLF